MKSSDSHSLNTTIVATNSEDDDCNDVLWVSKSKDWFDMYAVFY